MGNGRGEEHQDESHFHRVIHDLFGTRRAGDQTKAVRQHVRHGLMALLHHLMEIGVRQGLDLSAAYGKTIEAAKGILDLGLLFVFGRAVVGLTPREIELIWKGEEFTPNIPPAERVRAYLTADCQQALSLQEIFDIMGSMPEKTLAGMRGAGVNWPEIAQAMAISGEPMEYLIKALRREGLRPESINAFLSSYLPESRKAFDEACRQYPAFASEGITAAIQAFRENDVPLETLWEWSACPSVIFATSALLACQDNEELTETLTFLHQKEVPLANAVISLQEASGLNIEILVAAGYSDIAAYQDLPANLIEWPSDQSALTEIGRAFLAAVSTVPSRILNFLRERGFSAESAHELLFVMRILDSNQPVDPLHTRILATLYLAGYPQEELGTLEVRRLLGRGKAMTPRAFDKLWAQVASSASAAEPTSTAEESATPIADPSAPPTET
jgi:hypothetical protein